MIKTNLEDIKLLKYMIEVPSPSGYEKTLAIILKEKLEKILPKEQIKIDFKYNVIATIPGKSNKSIMIDAHLDTIGFIVSNIDKWGKISLQYIGGGDSTILSTQTLYVLTNNGKSIVKGVVDRKHSHLVRDEDTELIYDPSQVELDIGTKNPTEINKIIKIGDPVVYEHKFRELTYPYFAGSGLDDKSGCLILFKTIQQIIKSGITPEHTLIFTFSSQEETGYTKLLPLVRKYKPELCIEVDVTFATDYGDEHDMESEVGRCLLGKGISLYRGVDIDNDMLEIIFNIAKTKKIPYQIQACSGHSGYSSIEMSGEQNGVKCLVFGIPLRNMHSPNEVINFNDLTSGSYLLKSFLVSDKLKGKL